MLADNTESANLFKERETAEKAVSDLKIAKSAVLVEKRNFNSELAALLITPFIKFLREKKGSNVIRKWEKEAAEHLLENKNCLCGNPIDSEAKKSLESFTTTKHSYLSSMLDEADDLIYKFGSEELSIKLEEIRAKMTGIQNQMKTAEEDLEKKRKEMGETVGVDFDVANEEKILEKAEKERDKFHDDFNKNAGKLQLKQKELEGLQKKIEKSTEGTKHAEYSKLLAQAKKIYDATVAAVNALVDSQREKVEAITSETFLKMINTPKHFRGIEIDENYYFYIVHKDGVKIATYDAGQSAGQNQVIATAFIAALNRMSERKAAIVIDTPLGRLDEMHSTNMIKYYPNFKPQVIILYQPKELAGAESQQAIQEISAQIHSEWEIEEDAMDEHISYVKRVK